jgi:hypothetical protein
LSACFDGRDGARFPARLASRHVERLDSHVRPAAVGRVRAPSPRRAAECLYAEALKGAATYLRTDSGSRVRLPVQAWLGPATAAVGLGPVNEMLERCQHGPRSCLVDSAAPQCCLRRFVVIKPVPSPCGCSRQCARPWSRARASQSSARGGAPRGSSVRDRETCSRGARSPHMTRAGRTRGRGHRACPSL